MRKNEVDFGSVFTKSQSQTEVARKEKRMPARPLSRMAVPSGKEFALDRA